jgi:hypothetical protein
MTPSELALWISTPENLDAITVLIESGDLKLVLCPTGYTCLRTHSNDITKLEIGEAPVLPPASD